MKKNFLSAIMISISLLTFSCSNDESTPAPDSTVEEVIITQAKNLDGKPGNAESDESSRVNWDPYAPTCFSNGYGRTINEAETNARNKFRIHPCYNPNLRVIFVLRRDAIRGWACIASHPGPRS